MAPTPSPASPTADEFARAVLALNELREERKKGLAGVIEERNLMVEMAKLSRQINVEFNIHSQNIGSAVTEMSKLDKLNAMISARTRENNSLESIYIKQMGTIVSEKAKITDLALAVTETAAQAAEAATTQASLEQELTQKRRVLQAAEAEANRKNDREEKNRYAEELDAHDLEAAAARGLAENKKTAAAKAATDAALAAAANAASIVNKTAELKLIAKTIERNRTILEQHEQLAARERVKESMSEKFFGSTFKNLAKSDFGKAMGLDKVLKKFPLLAMALNGIGKLIAFAFETFKQFDSELFNLRKHFGLFRGQNEEQEKIATRIAQKYAAQGVTILESAAAAKALSNQFGRLSANSEYIVRDVALISTQLGISAEQSAKFLGSIATLSGKTLPEAAEISFGFAQSLNAAAGTNLPEVMGDIANMSDTVRTTFRGNTVELIKATVEARRFGLSLESVGKTSESLLEFNSSVNAEMEASVLLGRNINLMEARKAAFAGDYKKQQSEILKVVKSVGDFDKLNYMQKTALAKAVSMSVEDLQTMLQREKEIEYVRRKGSTHAKKLLETYEKMANMRKEEARDLEKDFRLRIKREQNQERMKSIQDNINKLMMDLSQVFLPTIDIILQGVVFLTGLLANGLGSTVVHVLGLGNALKRMGVTFASFVESLKQIKIFAKVAGWVEAAYAQLVRFGVWLKDLKIIKSALESAKQLSTVFKGVGELKFLKPLLNLWKMGKLGLKAVPVLGEVLMVLEAIWYTGKTLIFVIKDIFKSFSEAEGVLGFFKALGKSLLKLMYTSFLLGPKLVLEIFIKPIIELIDWMFGTSLGESIKNGISSISTWIREHLCAPFADAFDWIMSFFGGNSPSKLGLRIVDGIKSVGGLLFKFLVSPFNLAFDIISSIFKKIPELGSKIAAGIKSAGLSIFDALVSSFKLAFDVIRSIFKKGFDFIMNLPGVRFIKSIVGSIGSFFKGSSTPKETTVNPPLSVNPPSSENKTAKNSDEELNSDEGHQTDNQPILDKLDELINLMKSGGIAINLDGRKVSETLAYASR